MPNSPKPANGTPTSKKTFSSFSLLGEGPGMRACELNVFTYLSPVGGELHQRQNMNRGSHSEEVIDLVIGPATSQGLSILEASRRSPIGNTLLYDPGPGCQSDGHEQTTNDYVHFPVKVGPTTIIFWSPNVSFT
jgi:hypothetical protein